MSIKEKMEAYMHCLTSELLKNAMGLHFLQQEGGCVSFYTVKIERRIPGRLMHKGLSHKVNSFNWGHFLLFILAVNLFVNFQKW